MSPQDPRHGTTRGAAAGCGCVDCRTARNTHERTRRKRREVLGIQYRLDSTGTRRRIQALMAIGWRAEDIARQCGFTAPQQITEITAARKYVFPATANAVAAAYEAMSMTRGPSKLTSSRAARKGWPPPLAYDDIDTDPTAAPLATRCSVQDCVDAAHCRGWCQKHYGRWLRSGDPSGVGKGRRRGDDATYNAVHLRLKRDRGAARLLPCVDCAGKARTWSYNHTDSAVQVDGKGRPYSLDQSHYSPRCTACHNAFDRRAKEARDPYPRATALTDLDALGLGITEVCARLGVRRDNLERWCQRHGMSETYVRLTGRECWAKAAS